MHIDEVKKLKSFDLTQSPPDQGEVDRRLELSRKALADWHRKMVITAASEILFLACCYAGGLFLYDVSLESLGMGFLVMIIGPIVVMLGVSVIASFRRRELAAIVESLQPVVHLKSSYGELRGRADDVDRYLDALDAMGRKVTHAEAVMLRRLSRSSYRPSADATATADAASAA